MLRFPVGNMLGEQSFRPTSYVASYLPPSPQPPSPQLGQARMGDVLGVNSTVFGLFEVASIAASAYHGYKRNNSTGWGIWWGLMGGFFPIITPAIAIAQGFGKRERK